MKITPLSDNALDLETDRKVTYRIRDLRELGLWIWCTDGHMDVTEDRYGNIIPLGTVSIIILDRKEE